MAAITEDSILFFRATDLAEIRFLVSHFPIANTLTMSLSILVTTDVFIAGLLFNIGSLSMAHIFNPVTIVGITRRVVHLSLAMAPSKDKVTLVDGASA